MTAKLLPASKCSQMDNPLYGSGTGGDRCTEAVAAMIDCTYKIGPSAQQGGDPEKIMYEFTEMLNQGRDVSGLEDASWISAWVKQHSNGQITLGDLHGATFADIKACVDRGHLAILGVHDYSLLKAYDGSDPYQWNPANEHVGHVLLLVGYNEDMVDSQGKHWGETVVVHDPLRGTRGQPWDYSWASVQAARLDDLMEVDGPRLDGVAPTPAQPAPAPDPRDAAMAQLHTALDAATSKIQELQTALDAATAKIAQLAAQPAPDFLTQLTTWLGPARSDPIFNPDLPGVTLHVFERGILVQDPSRALDNPPGVLGPVYLGSLSLLKTLMTAGILPLESNAQTQITALQGQLEAAQNQIKDLTAQNGAHQEQATPAPDQHALLVQMQQERDQALQARDAAQQQVQALQQATANPDPRDGQIARLTEQLAMAHAASQGSMQQIATLSNILVSVRQSEQQQRDLAGQLQSEVDALKAAASSVAPDQSALVAEAKQTIDQLTAALQQAQTDLANAQQAAPAAPVPEPAPATPTEPMVPVSILDAKTAALEAELETLKAAQAQMHAENGQLQTALSQAQGDVELVQKLRDRLTAAPSTALAS